MVYMNMKTKWGPVVVGINNNNEIFGLWFEGQKYFPQIDEGVQWIKEEDLNETVDKSAQVLKCLITQMRAYEEGVQNEFDLPLAPTGTEFRKKVWGILQQIPCGETITYGDISKKLAKAMNVDHMSAQAVGGAVGHNPISIIIPCHRVVGAKGQLTGYAGGIDKKEALLNHERNLELWK